MLTRSLRRRFLSFLAITALAGTGAVALIPPTQATAATPDVTITPNPSYQSEAFEGWGTSLAWFANATGDYPDDVRNTLREAVFGEDGLNLNIARYNIGGGDASDVPPYLRPGGAVEGWWNPQLEATDSQGPITSTYADRERYRSAWDGDDLASYNLKADGTQRWWIDALKKDITKWEAFSNSPPYFLTASGFVSGGRNNATSEQLAEADMEAFADYLVAVVDELEKVHGISFATIDPFNEPNTNYWQSRIGANGWPTSESRQEGAHIGPRAQDKMIQVLASRLAENGTQTKAIISAMDETNPSTFVRNWQAYSADARQAVGQYNVHTYSTSDRQVVRDISKVENTNLWMSEVEGDWSPGKGLDLSEMGNGLGMAQRIADDLRELEPRAWVFWQPVEDLYNMEKVEKLNWGSVLIDFDCDANGNSARRLADGDADPSCKVLTNSKYNTVRNYTHYIRPGAHLIPTTSNESTAAVRADGSGVDIVHTNSSSEERTVALDLSRFASVAGATVTPVVTTQSPADRPTANALVKGTPVAVDQATATATLTVPARSVTTFVIDGATGIADDAPLLKDGHSYDLRGVQSGLSLTAKDRGIVIDNTAAETAADQVWRVTTLSGSGTNEQKVTLTNVRGQVLANVDGSAAAIDPEEVSPQARSWIVTTTNGVDLSLVSATEPVVAEVNGQAREPGSRVGTYTSNGGGNQRWTARDVTISGFKPVTVNTAVAQAPTLPSTVTPLYADGAGSAVTVTWNLEEADWSTPGTVTITGSGTDQYGAAFDNAKARVEVGPASSTDPTSVTLAVGTKLADAKAILPTTVPAQAGSSAFRFQAPVTWDLSGLTQEYLDTPGIYPVAGTAVSGGAQLEARLNILVVEAVPTNIAPSSRTSASFVEPGYSTDGTVNGIRTDKAWSNWRSGAKNTTDTLTYTLARAETIKDASLFFYKDGESKSWPVSILAEYLPAEGATSTHSEATDAWLPAHEVPVPDSDQAPVVTVDFDAVQAKAIRFTLTARPQTHMILSEVEINALQPAPSSVSSLARLTVDGADVEGFNPSHTSYELSAAGTEQPSIVAIPTDQDATVSSSQDAHGTTTLTVTAPDGSTTVYTVSINLSPPTAGPEDPAESEGPQDPEDPREQDDPDAPQDPADPPIPTDPPGKDTPSKATSLASEKTPRRDTDQHGQATSGAYSENGSLTRTGVDSSLLTAAAALFLAGSALVGRRRRQA